MGQLLYRIGLSVFFSLLFSVAATAKPELISKKPVCVDGFCIELGGRDLLNEGAAPTVAEDRRAGTFINIFHGADASKRLGRIFRHEFLWEASSGDEDLLVLDLASPEIERIFAEDGLYVSVVNPSLQDAKRSAKTLVKWDHNPVVICEDFDDQPPGAYALPDLKADFFSHGSRRGWLRSVAADEAVITSNVVSPPGSDAGNNVLSAVNRKGRWGPLGAATDGGRTGGGLTFNTLICASGDCDRDDRTGSFTTSKGFEELLMSYWIRFEGLDGGDFDFRRGGKLPGFAGGQTNVATGGGHKGVLPDGRNGWSARATFAADGRAYQYLYYPDNRNPLAGSKKYGENRSWMLRGEPFRFDSNRWYRVQQRVKMNTVDPATGRGRTDGEIEVWVDNDVVLNERVRFRHAASPTHAPDQAPFHIGKLLDIDTVAMGLFHGGGTPGHAPTKDVRWLIDDFMVFAPLDWAGSGRGC